MRKIKWGVLGTAEGQRLVTELQSLREKKGGRGPWENWRTG